MIEIGKVNNLVVDRETSSGFYLKSDDLSDEVFMPPSMGPLRIELGQNVKVFVYLDTNSCMIATTQIPYAIVGEFALMRVINTEEFGAFFDWGIAKDLLVPGNEQKLKVQNYESHVVRVCLEEGTNRVYGTTKLGNYIQDSDFDIEEGDKVCIVPVSEEELGYSVIINKKFMGMIYHNEIFSKVKIGHGIKGVVKKIRVDGLVDVALQTQGILNIVEAKEKILEMLDDWDGRSPLHDKSSPEQIKDILGMSKKTFKNAIGMLYKEKKIIINKDSIELSK